MIVINRAVNMITQHFGSVVASSIRNLPVERLPVLALIQRIRGVMDIAQVCFWSRFLHPSTTVPPEKMKMINFLKTVFRLS